MAYGQAADILGRLVKENPTNATFASTYARTLRNRAESFRLTGKAIDALVQTEAALAIAEKLAKEKPDVVQFVIDLGNSWHIHANALNAAHQVEESVPAYTKAIAILKSLSDKQPNQPQPALEFISACTARGMAIRSLEQYPEAEASFRDAIKMETRLARPTREQYYQLARCHAALANLAGEEGVELTKSQGMQARESAMGFLQKAAALGYRNAGACETDPVFESLWRREDFQKLVEEMKKRGPNN